MTCTYLDEHLTIILHYFDKLYLDVISSKPETGFVLDFRTNACAPSEGQKMS